MVSVDDGRLDTLALGQVLGQIMHGGDIPSGRVAGTLRSAARASARHLCAVSEIIESMLAGQDPGAAPRDTWTLLELFHELMVEQAGRPGETTLTWLRGVKSGGKTGKIVHTLMAHTEIS